MKDDLHTLLHTWHPPLPSTADIRRGVWRRLDNRERAAAFPRALRAAMALLVIGLALGTGLHLGRAASATSLTQAYLSSVNPYSHFQ